MKKLDRNTEYDIEGDSVTFYSYDPYEISTYVVTVTVKQLKKILKEVQNEEECN